jgi:hypothetical protein
MEEYSYVLINGDFGGFGLSDIAIAEYNKRLLEINPDNKPIQQYSKLRRHDPILIELYNLLGKEGMNDKHSCLELVKIPTKYINHYKIREYDGNESVIILYDKYKIDIIDVVLNAGDLSDRERMIAIRKIMAIE